MEQATFINEGFDNALKEYINRLSSGQRIIPVDFDLQIIRVLVTIYGESIINAYKDKNETDFKQELKKFGFTDEKIDTFYQKMNEFYCWKKENRLNKTKLINDIQRLLIEMITYKDNSFSLEEEEIATYNALLYVEDNHNNIAKVYNLLYAYDKEEISLLWKKTKEDFETKINLTSARPDLLDEDLYVSYGLSMEEISDLDDSQLEEINTKIKEYYTQEEDNTGGRTQILEDTIQLVLKPSDLKSGGGFVDALLLGGIILTIIAIAIIAYNFFGG